MELQKLPVFKLFLAKQLLAAVSAPAEQQQEFMQKHDQYMAQVGGKVLLAADCAWSNEEFDMFGFEEFPNLDAMLEFHDCLSKMNWFAYFQSKTYLGWMIDFEGNPVPYAAPPPPAAGTKPIYKAVLSRPTPHYIAETEKADAIDAQNNEAAFKAGMLQILYGYTRLNNEEWMIFGLERYPSLDVFTDKYVRMEKSGWFKYIQAKSYLGTAIGGTLSGL